MKFRNLFSATALALSALTNDVGAERLKDIPISVVAVVDSSYVASLDSKISLTSSAIDSVGVARAYKLLPSLWHNIYDKIEEAEDVFQDGRLVRSLNGSLDFRLKEVRRVEFDVESSYLSGGCYHVESILSDLEKYHGKADADFIILFTGKNITTGRTHPSNHTFFELDGVVSGIGERFAIVTASGVSSSARNVLAHEIGHQLGAMHVGGDENSGLVMDGYAIQPAKLDSLNIVRITAKVNKILKERDLANTGW